MNVQLQTAQPAVGFWIFIHTAEKGGDGGSLCACCFFIWQVPRMTAWHRRTGARRRLHYKFSRKKKEYLWLFVKAQSLCWAALALWCSMLLQLFVRWGSRKDIPAVLRGWAVALHTVINPSLPFLGIFKYRAEVLFSMTVSTVIHYV